MDKVHDESAALVDRLVGGRPVHSPVDALARDAGRRERVIDVSAPTRRTDIR